MKRNDYKGNKRNSIEGSESINGHGGRFSVTAICKANVTLNSTLYSLYSVSRKSRTKHCENKMTQII